MRERTFRVILLAVIAICLLLTLGHLIYAIDAYQRCSIIYFIAKELW